MRVSRKEMEESHRRIVTGAARLARERGVERMSVADVMGEAGLTNGGFYRHFESKDALVEAALRLSFDEFGGALEERFERMPPKAAVQDYRQAYLSSEHVDHPELGCPIAALGGDVGHGPQALKKAFGEGVERAVKALAHGMDGSNGEKGAAAMRELAMLVGAVVIARASDGETGERVLAACRGNFPANA